MTQLPTRLKYAGKFLSLSILVFSIPLMGSGTNAAVAKEKAGQTKLKTAKQKTTSQAPLGNVKLLIKAGALELAIQAINRHQEKTEINAEWISWEKSRYRLYFKRQQWKKLQARYDSYQDNMPGEVRTWAMERMAHSRLQQGEGAEARIFLRKLIWFTESSKKKADRKRETRWRRLVIESYLSDNRVNDADLALIQYQRDYPGRSVSWQILRGKVLIQKGRFRDGFEVLSGIQRLEARLLKLYAALEAGIYQPGVVIKSARRIGKLKYANSNLQKKSWILISRAAAKSKNSSLHIAALENALQIQSKNKLKDPLFQLNADDLWKAYIKFAETYGNKKRLLVGDDSAWMKQAENLEKKKKNIQPRAIYAFLSIKGSIDIVREIAHKRFTDSLYESKLGLVAVALYTKGKTAGPVKGLPDTVRYRLAIEILRSGDIKLAAEIMKSLTQPPAEESVRDWKLRRARTMVYAGEFKEAEVLLGQVVESDPRFKEEFIRRFNQVVFDLQAVGEHAAALKLFNGVYLKTQNKEMQRELLFWMAESKVAAGSHGEAAELYLRSAYHGQPRGGDMWGQSARYYAAESLAKAGYSDDARSVYENLLRHTPDAKRRAIIERNLQQLWLKKQAIQIQ